MHHLDKMLLYIMLLAAALPLSAQQTFREVDSISYDLYKAKSWDSLAAYGTKAYEAGYDYYYLNMRTAIAWYELHNYAEALKFFEQAYHNNSTAPILKEYLFWSNYYLMRDLEAGRWYRLLDDSVRQGIYLHEKRRIDALYAEGGLRLPLQRGLAGPLGYAQLALQAYPVERLGLSQAFSYITQQINWGEYEQYQYYLHPTWMLNRNTNIYVAGHWAHYNSRLDYEIVSSDTGSYRENSPMGEFRVDTILTSTYNIRGRYLQSDILLQAGLSKSGRQYTLTPYASLWLMNEKPYYTETYKDTLHIFKYRGPVLVSEFTGDSDSTSIPSGTYDIQWVLGISGTYHLGKVSIGGDFKFTGTGNAAYWFFSPFLAFRPDEKWLFTVYYFSKKKHPVSLFSGYQLFNTFDELQRVSLSTRYRPTEKTELYTTMQLDRVVDGLIGEAYQMYGLYFGINFKF